MQRRDKERHGMAKSPEYSSWCSMVMRCTNPKDEAWESYGGRGITIAPSMRTFTGFFSVMGIRPRGFSLDRIDNNGNYEPGNVRWASRTQQNRNQRTNRMIEYCGKTKTLADWADELSIRRGTLITRIDTYGWSIEKAMTHTPWDKPRKLSMEQVRRILNSDGVGSDVLAAEFGVARSMINRIRAGTRWKKRIEKLTQACASPDE